MFLPFSNEELNLTPKMPCWQSERNMFRYSRQSKVVTLYQAPIHCQFMKEEAKLTYGD